MKPRRAALGATDEVHAEVAARRLGTAQHFLQQSDVELKSRRCGRAFSQAMGGYNHAAEAAAHARSIPVGIPARRVLERQAALVQAASYAQALLVAQACGARLHDAPASPPMLHGARRPRRRR